MEHQSFVDLTCPAGRSGLKRSHSKSIQTQMATRASRERSTPSSRGTPENTAGPSIRQPRLSPRLARFSGDGLDFRRPATSTTSHHETDFVDLTVSDEEEEDNDDIQITSFTTNNSNGQTSAAPARVRPSLRPARRGPRFAREIIHVDEASEDSHSSHYNHAPLHDARGPSDDQYQPPADLRSRRLPPLPHRAPRPNRHRPGNWNDGGHQIGQLQLPPPDVIEIDDEQDNEPLRRQLMRNVQSGRPAMENVRQGHISHAMALLRTVRAHAGIPHMFRPSLDYTMAAFEMGMQMVNGTNQRQRTPPPSPPAYESLPAVKDGFTRSPKEGDVLVCPFCGNELCMGDSPTRSQVWVVKSCGHVYCGDCASTRPKSKPKKTSKTSAERQFTTCVVDGCGERVTGAKSMYQLFL